MRRTRPRRRGAGSGGKVRQSWTFTGNFMRRSAERLSCLFCRRQNPTGDCALWARKRHALGVPFSLSIKFMQKRQPRGSAHERAFAAQTHPNRGRVPRFGYFEREKVSAWELSDVRVLRSQNTDCRKNAVFRQSQASVFCEVRTHLPAEHEFCR